MAKANRLGRTPTVAALLVATLALGLAATAGAVDVRGSLTIQGKLVNPGNSNLQAPLKPYWNEWNGFLEPGDTAPPPSRVLSLALIGHAPVGTQPTGCSYALRGGDFDPTTMVAQKGTTLRIDNTDGCSHELYSDDLDGFSALQTSPGNARTVPLTKTGHFIIRDKLYSHVIGDLHVVDGLVACAQIDPHGRFEFKDVPAGSYTLKVFYGARVLASQTVDATGRRAIIPPLTLSPQGK